MLLATRPALDSGYVEIRGPLVVCLVIALSGACSREASSSLEPRGVEGYTQFAEELKETLDAAIVEADMAVSQCMAAGGWSTYEHVTAGTFALEFDFPPATGALVGLFDEAAAEALADTQAPDSAIEFVRDEFGDNMAGEEAFFDRLHGSPPEQGKVEDDSERPCIIHWFEVMDAATRDIGALGEEDQRWDRVLGQISDYEIAWSQCVADDGFEIEGRIGLPTYIAGLAEGAVSDALSELDDDELLSPEGDDLPLPEEALLSQVQVSTEYRGLQRLEEADSRCAERTGWSEAYDEALLEIE